jgi:hypothetical protein
MRVLSKLSLAVMVVFGGMGFGFDCSQTDFRKFETYLENLCGGSIDSTQIESKAAVLELNKMNQQVKKFCSKGLRDKCLGFNFNATIVWSRKSLLQAMETEAANVGAYEIQYKTENDGLARVAVQVPVRVGDLYRVDIRDAKAVQDTLNCLITNAPTK